MNTQNSRETRAMKALTGLSYEEFINLVPTFEQTIITLKMEEKGRQRKVGGGQKGKLKTIDQKLFFILFYLIFPDPYIRKRDGSSFACLM